MNDKRIKRSAVAFPDTNLEVAIRKNINKPQGLIYTSDLEPLTGLDLEVSNISDISALSGLTNLQWLGLLENNISDIEPLFDNAGLAGGDIVNLENNPLSPESINSYIPQLEARGVTVHY